MQKGDTNKPFRIGTWLVEPGLNRVSDGDHVVALDSRLMDTLMCLTSRSGKIVSADEMLDTVWHGRAHGDNSIYQAIAQLRKVLGEDVHHPRFIETIPKKGYRLICPVVPVVMDDELHATSETGFGRRFVALIAGIALLAVAITLTVNPEFQERSMPSADTPREKSVAVLPFVDMSEDGSQQYFSDGVTEELIHVLSKLPDLRVTARTSSFAFRDSNEDFRQIGSKLNVATILEGSVRKDGDRIRITAQLVDTRNGYHLWSQTFDRESTDIFWIQKEIAAAVATAFDYQGPDALATVEHAVRAVNLDTYELYLLGLHYLRKETMANDLIAIEYFERAIEMDPEFARAYAGLSEIYASQSVSKNDLELLRKAESAAEYALALDDQSAEAFVALGHAKLIRRDHAAAESAFVKAIKLDPNHVQAYRWLAYVYEDSGREEEALVMLQKALELNPMSGETNVAIGAMQYARNGWDVAFVYYKQAMQRDPDYYGSYARIGNHYRWTGHLDQAILYARKVVDLTDSLTTVRGSEIYLTELYVDIGDYDSAAKQIRRMRGIESDHFGTTNTEIHLQLARRNFSAARNLIHSTVSRHVGNDAETSLLAFYEMVIGDESHAEKIYAHLAAAPEIPNMRGELNLYSTNELSWGMLGAVNLAYLHKRNGEYLTAQRLLGKAREFIASKSHPGYALGISYVRAQIAAVNGDNISAIEYFRKAVDVGWTKSWFARIDPVMADLRKDARFMQILEELEDKLLKTRESSKLLASNKL